MCSAGPVTGSDIIQDDDGDPDWVDIQEYGDRVGPNEYDMCDYIGSRDPGRMWRRWNASELFVDFPHPRPRHPGGEIIRVRSSTLAPEILRSYRNCWNGTSMYSDFLKDESDEEGGGSDEEGAEEEKVSIHDYI